MIWLGKYILHPMETAIWPGIYRGNTFNAGIKTISLCFDSPYKLIDKK